MNIYYLEFSEDQRPRDLRFMFGAHNQDVSDGYTFGEDDKYTVEPLDEDDLDEYYEHAGEDEDATLDDVFVHSNVGKRSLSVGDIVVEETDDGRVGHVCRAIGWDELDSSILEGLA